MHILSLVSEILKIWQVSELRGAVCLLEMFWKSLGKGRLKGCKKMAFGIWWSSPAKSREKQKRILENSKNELASLWFLFSATVLQRMVYES